MDTNHSLPLDNTTDLETVTWDPSLHVTIDEITTAMSTPDKKFQTLMTNRQKELVDIYFIAVFGTTLSLAGICANILNLIVYLSQKTKDKVSISLTYLSVSDTGVLIGTLFSCLCYAVFRYDPLTKVDPMSLQWGIGAQVRHMFINISLLTTVFVSMERCLCVVLPIKIKILITPKITHLTNICFYIFIVATYIPDCISKHLAWTFDPKTNSTRLKMLLAPDRKAMEHIKDSINHIAIPFGGQIVITCTTIMMITTLKSASNFRRESQMKEGAGMSLKEKRLMKLIAIISTIFFFCNLPMVVGMTCRRFFPDFKINGPYHNIHLTVFAIVFITAAFSATINIFVYYKGNTKYRETFRYIFCNGDESKSRREKSSSQ